MEEGAAHSGESRAGGTEGGRHAASYDERSHLVPGLLDVPGIGAVADQLAEQELTDAIDADSLGRSIWEGHDEEAKSAAAGTERQPRPLPPDPEEVGDRLAEQAIIDAIRFEGLDGPSWRTLQRILAEYGLAVLVPWIRSAVIFVRCREQGLQLRPWRTAPTREQAEDLATTTTARALNTFVRRTLRGDGWNSSGGASLATWFIGCCLFEFANEWRLWVAAQNRADESSIITLHEREWNGLDPEAQVVSEEAAKELLASMGRIGGQVVLLKLYGYKHKEIAALLALPSERAVEGVLYRVRNSLRGRRSSGEPVEEVGAGSEGGRL